VTPSVNDILVAKKLKLIGQLIGINVLDSLVVSEDNFSSLEQLELLDLEINASDLFE
ncbi:TPA: JAB domain-containing protein, partial [Staphylococcus aureus]